MDKIRVVIVDDMPDLVDYFKSVLNNEPDIEVVGTAHSGREGVEVTLSVKPDIVLMDLQMEYECAGIDAIAEIKSREPDIKVIVLSVNEDNEMLFKAFAAGGNEYILKTDSIVKLIESIHLVYHNQLSLSPQVSQKILGEFSRLRTAQDSLLYTMNVISKLTMSEFEVLKALSTGKSYKQVAEERCVETSTIRSQVNRILKKFDEKSIKSIVKKLEPFNILNVDITKR